jgi:DNA-binding transcriptional MerR regulator
MIKEYYSTKEAADLVGCSPQILRTYTARYERYLSTEATPEPGAVRRFTFADLSLIAFVYTKTSKAGENLTHEQVQELLAAGALDSFDWQPETLQAAQSASDSTTDASTALVPLAQMQAAQALLNDAQRRERDALERVDQIQERLEAIQRELGEARGELSAYKSLRPKRPAWWLWLFGGEQG